MVPAMGSQEERNTEMLGYAKALCNAIAADGEASPGEIAWVQGYLSCKGFGALAGEVQAMAKAAEGKSIAEVVEDTKASMQVGTLKFAGRAIIFDSIRAAIADGLDPQELQAIAAIAGAFDLDGIVVGQLLALVEEEGLGGARSIIAEL